MSYQKQKNNILAKAGRHVKNVNHVNRAKTLDANHNAARDDKK